MYTFQEVREMFNTLKDIAPRDITIELFQLDGRIWSGVTLRISEQGKFNSNYPNLNYDTVYEILEMLYNIYS